MYSANDLPSPRDALGERGAGNVLDAFHQLDERRLATRAHRREADAAVAHHARRDAVQRRGEQLPSHDDLAVVVRVDVDEAGQHVRAGRHQSSRRAGPRHVADLDDPAVLHGDVARERGAPRPVDDVPPAILRSNTTQLLHCKIFAIKT